MLGAAVTTMLKSLVSLPTAFVALNVKLNVPVTVGEPEIMLSPQAFIIKLKPGGRLPLAIDHVIGSLPVAVSATP